MVSMPLLDMRWTSQSIITNTSLRKVCSVFIHMSILERVCNQLLDKTLTKQGWILQTCM